ncbi:alkylation response protein AidB-like acyl-CoA dehydrogenase [Sagittula marina]|uniref:Alkylation response protein AidB-like acyl-CoA dehydrogenase n=1 Tax=Sagittula marina TaxID=943940 RepID=A0A7W6GRH1_9RHOB|nr:acyl-CoA dehydrogenase family protein [Sagittula marina]MBB3985366.1 alkylation response protein AidB-like acyl-CoA dehydrogenase [Sagittula marina]
MTTQERIERSYEPGAYAAQARGWIETNLTDALRTDRATQEASLAEKIAFEAAQHEAGLVGITWPVEYGGHGLGLREHLEANREIGLSPMPNAVNSIGKELAGPIIMTVGRDDQKRDLLPKILKMENIWCQGFSEPGAGSDLVALRTRAEKTADGWKVNGQKIWTSGASKSQYCLLLARTGSADDRHKGLMLFAVPMESPGIDVREIVSIDGARSFCEVFFNNVMVAEENMLGAPDEGWAAASRVLSIERATNRMYRSWRFESEIDHLVAACRSDNRTYQILKGYSAEIAQARIAVENLKGHVETMVADLLNGQQIGPRGSLPKLYWSEAHQRWAQMAYEVTTRFPLDGGQALTDARARFETIYLASRAETIYAGTTEIQLDIISKRILNLKKAA